MEEISLVSDISGYLGQTNYDFLLCDTMGKEYFLLINVTEDSNNFGLLFSRIRKKENPGNIGEFNNYVSANTLKEHFDNTEAYILLK